MVSVEKTAWWGSLWSVILTKCLDDQIQMNEMGEAYGVYGGEQRCVQGFGREAWGKEITRKN
jgi:hypothetical protein